MIKDFNLLGYCLYNHFQHFISRMTSLRQSQPRIEESTDSYSELSSERHGYGNVWRYHSNQKP